jgi:hypothetical protein
VNVMWLSPVPAEMIHHTMHVTTGPRTYRTLPLKWARSERTCSVSSCSFCFTSSTLSVGSTCKKKVCFFLFTRIYIDCGAMHVSEQPLAARSPVEGHVPSRRYATVGELAVLVSYQIIAYETARTTSESKRFRVRNDGVLEQCPTRGLTRSANRLTASLLF